MLVRNQLISGLLVLLLHVNAVAQAKEISTSQQKLLELLKSGQNLKAGRLVQSYLSLVKLRHGENSIEYAEATFLVGTVHRALGRYGEAEKLYKTSLRLRKKHLDADDPLIGESEHAVGTIFFRKARYKEAKSSYDRALQILKNKLGSQNSKVAQVLNDLGVLLYKKGLRKEAETYIQNSYEIRRNVLPSDHADIAESLNDLGEIEYSKGNYVAAEKLFRQAISIWTKSLAPKHPDVGIGLNNLASLSHSLGRYSEATMQYERARSIFRQANGDSHQSVGSSIKGLAALHFTRGELPEAEQTYRRVLTIKRNALGPRHPEVASILHDLAGVSLRQGLLDQAEEYANQTLSIEEQVFGDDHPDLAPTLNTLAAIYIRKKHKPEEIERLFKRAIEILKNAKGEEHRDVGRALSNYAHYFTSIGKFSEAEDLHLQSLKVLEMRLGDEHPEVGVSANNLGFLYHLNSQLVEAEANYKKALKILERALGPDHPNVGNIIDNLAELYSEQKRFDDEEKMRLRLEDMPEPMTRHVRLHFGTNRTLLEGIRFGDSLSKKVYAGRMIMTVPEDQVRTRAMRIADIKYQASNRSITNLTDAKLLKEVRTRRFKTNKGFAASVRASQVRSAKFANKALVFVHGYNVDFKEAMRRATQLSFDLNFDGVLMPFVWPSQGKLLSYFTDQDMANNSTEKLVDFLDAIRDTLPKLEIHLIAHSHGNQLMLKALCDIANRHDDKPHKFGQVISAHADVSQVDFTRWTECFHKRVKGITSYVDENDLVLRLRCLGWWCRAGNYARSYPFVEVIDTTEMSRSAHRSLDTGLNHDTFVRNPILFNDITLLLLTGLTVKDRTNEFRLKKDKESNIYWAYDKTYDPTASPIASPQKSD